MAKPVVYIIDDDDNVRRSTCFLLHSYDFRCRSFPDGESFLAQMDELEPGCVLLDMYMPRSSGLEVQAELARRGAKLPVIAMSGDSGMQAARIARELGAIDVLEKPFAEDALLGALRAGFALLETIPG